jgi:hypothetical protein
MREFLLESDTILEVPLQFFVIAESNGGVDDLVGGVSVHSHDSETRGTDPRTDEAFFAIAFQLLFDFTYDAVKDDD